MRAANTSTVRSKSQTSAASGGSKKFTRQQSKQPSMTYDESVLHWITDAYSLSNKERCDILHRQLAALERNAHLSVGQVATLHGTHRPTSRSASKATDGGGLPSERQYAVQGGGDRAGKIVESLRAKLQYYSFHEDFTLLAEDFYGLLNGDTLVMASNPQSPMGSPKHASDDGDDGATKGEKEESGGGVKGNNAAADGCVKDDTSPTRQRKTLSAKSARISTLEELVGSEVTLTLSFGSHRDLIVGHGSVVDELRRQVLMWGRHDVTDIWRSGGDSQVCCVVNFSEGESPGFGAAFHDTLQFDSVTGQLESMSRVVLTAPPSPLHFGTMAVVETIDTSVVIPSEDD